MDRWTNGQMDWQGVGPRGAASTYKIKFIEYPPGYGLRSLNVDNNLLQNLNEEMISTIDAFEHWWGAFINAMESE